MMPMIYKYILFLRFLRLFSWSCLPAWLTQDIVFAQPHQSPHLALLLFAIHNDCSNEINWCVLLSLFLDWLFQPHRPFQTLSLTVQLLLNVSRHMSFDCHWIDHVVPFLWNKLHWLWVSEWMSLEWPCVWNKSHLENWQSNSNKSNSTQNPAQINHRSQLRSRCLNNYDNCHCDISSVFAIAVLVQKLKS